MKKSKQNKNEMGQMKYDPEANVLSWEISGAPIDHAIEMGNVVVHFSPKNFPVFIEILNASKWVKQSEKALKSHKTVAVPV